ncbi:uncharacterized protein [Sinocyclocheilus grahami]|uniref:uncharacterized protein n=1 Tax=Sinocyclocheilus grahami TaxID=75366 RepID=UPI0007AD2A9D|nr:PREDICTED: uncharacterized protein LOC107558580 [Sinocyclocheilus grahami]
MIDHCTWTCSPKGRLQSGAVGADMSVTRGPSGLSMNTVELKHQWAMQRNRTLVRTYLLSSSVLPLPGSRSRDDFRLPSLLSRSTHGRTTAVPLSVSEPCLFTPGQRAVFEGFSKIHHPLLHTPGPSPSCKTLEKPKMPQQSYHQVYMHFSQPLKPVPKVGQAFTHSQQQATENRGLQPLVRQRRQPANLETLSVRGKTCLPTQHLPTSSSSASRTQLHVFLPAEGAGQEEDRDSESVDEGFMDELDNKVTNLRLLQDPKTPKQIEKSLTGQMVKLTS